MSYQLPFTTTELNEIKLRAHHQNDSLLLSLFEHIDNPSEVTKLKQRIADLESELEDYREQVGDLEDRLDALE
jgi:predicted  nucleic acid-binding Zn-ribbon protein